MSNRDLDLATPDIHLQRARRHPTFAKAMLPPITATLDKLCRELSKSCAEQ
jgi:hypothetical protein